MTTLLNDLQHEFLRHKKMADRALAEIGDEEFFQRPGSAVNGITLIVKHLAGNMLSRWTDFLMTDGEKPTRDRDSEFVLTDADTRASLMAAWERGWSALTETLASLTDADLEKSITIRGESQTARQALLRGLTHVAYHTGQILYLVRLLRPDSAWQTIAPGKSAGFQGNYRRP